MLSVAHELVLNLRHLCIPFLQLFIIVFGIEIEKPMGPQIFDLVFDPTTRTLLVSYDIGLVIYTIPSAWLVCEFANIDYLDLCVVHNVSRFVLCVVLQPQIPAVSPVSPANSTPAAVSQSLGKITKRHDHHHQKTHSLNEEDEADDAWSIKKAKTSASISGTKQKTTTTASGACKSESTGSANASVSSLKSTATSSAIAQHLPAEFSKISQAQLCQG